jgi:hypothetical protein
MESNETRRILKKNRSHAQNKNFQSVDRGDLSPNGDAETLDPAPTHLSANASLKKTKTKVLFALEYSTLAHAVRVRIVATNRNLLR